MSKKKKTSKTKDRASVDRALATLIRNTRTTVRHISLPEIAKWLTVATDFFGTVQEVADRIGLSPQMLRQFLAVTRLAPSVKELFAQRKLDSVDMAAHLRLLNPSDQEVAAQEAATGDLNSADIRAICEFRKENPEIDIHSAIEQVRSTRNVKHYVIEFVVRGPRVRRDTLLRRFTQVLGEDSIESLQMDGSIGKATVNQAGRSKLRRVARQQGLTLEDTVNLIVKGDLSE